MIRQDWILSKVKTLMAEYLADMLIEADKPRRKFLRQALGAILISGSLIVSEFGLWIHDDCSDIFYRIKRLLNHLVSPQAPMASIVQAYRRAMPAAYSPPSPKNSEKTRNVKQKQYRTPSIPLIAILSFT